VYPLDDPLTLPKRRLPASQQNRPLALKTTRTLLCRKL
jgi:hypothetical protein